MTPRAPSDAPQVLLIDDQPHQVLPWLEQVLPDYTLLPVSSEPELAALLDGQVIERLPVGPYRPIAALVDLDLGAGGGSGLSVIRRLRAHPVSALTTTILFTNGLAGRDDRDLLAVMAAYANGDGLLASTKDEPDGRRLRTVLAAAKATAAAGGVLSAKRPIGGLRYVPPLTLRSVHTQRPPCDLVELLLGEPGLRALWGHYADCGADFDQAVDRARDQYPGFLRRGGRAPKGAAQPRGATQSTGGEPPAGRAQSRAPSRSHLANDLLAKRDFGELFLSWHMYGDSFLNVPGTVMEPQGLGTDAEYRQHSSRRRLVLGMFFARYGRLLMASETHAFAEAYMAERGRPCGY